MHPITYLQAFILGSLQGVSELFPVSSLGHSVILPQIFHWQLSQNGDQFLIFLVATHFATALVLVGFFADEWLSILGGLGRSIAKRRIDPGDSDAILGWLLVAGTIPAGILGLLFQDSLRQFFASAQAAALFLIVNGFILFGAECLRRRADQIKDVDVEISHLKWPQAVAIGAAQSLALIPGFSRSGSAMAGSLLAGLSNFGAARFSFLLATPIILAASLLKLPALFAPEQASLRGPALLGAVCAGIAAYLSVRFLSRYFEQNRLTPFAAYCMIAGVIYSILLLLKI